MRRRLITASLCLVLIPAGQSAQAQTDGRPAARSESQLKMRPVAEPVAGETVYRGTASPGTSRSRSLAEMARPTDASRDQVAARQRKVRLKPHPTGPGLLQEAPAPRSLRVPGPPALLTADALATTPSLLPPIHLARTGSPSAAAPGGFSSVVNEPSVVAVGERVFSTGNWYAAASDDGGATFSFVDPFQGPFPPANNGFCCDQLVAYDAPTDTLIWLQQYIQDGTSGTQRFNIDQGADGTFECFYDFTPQDAAFGPGNWADYPDLTTGGGFLYHSTNVFLNMGGFSGAVVTRWDLAAMSTCGTPTVDVFKNTQGFGSFKLTRGAAGTMYFVSHISTASMRIWSWPTADAAPSSVDRAVTFWSNATRLCAGPDNRDWCGFIDQRHQAAYVAGGKVGFVWTPAQDAAHPYPYVRFARFTEGDLTLVDEPEFWSPDEAIVYPSVAVNGNGDLGGTFMAGGGGTYPGCHAWIADDASGDALQPVQSVGLYRGASGPSINRSGDYTGAHTYYPDDDLWTGVCFGYGTPAEGTSSFAVFGRAAAVEPMIFSDGFDAGSTAAWSRQVP